jgi:hypothetical protein
MSCMLPSITLLLLCITTVLVTIMTAISISIYRIVHHWQPTVDHAIAAIMEQLGISTERRENDPLSTHTTLE